MGRLQGWFADGREGRAPPGGMEIAIDLGTANVLVAIKGRGVVLREPSVVAIERDSGRTVAIGEEARRMLGRTPGTITAIRPLKDGVIADYDVTEAMMRYFIQRAVGRSRLTKPRVMICVPTAATGSEKRAVREAARAAGAGRVELIDEALAAALGLGLDIHRPVGNMVVDIGGGTADVAVLSLGGIHASESVRVAGDKMDQAVQNEIRRVYGLSIGDRTAEEAKIHIGSVHPDGRAGTYEIRGRDIVSGLPRNLELRAEDIRPALLEPVSTILNAIKGVLERTAPELVADIAERGIWLTGGASLLHGLPELVARETGVPAQLAEDPLSTVALGTVKALETRLHEDHLVLFPRVV
jgi:rod shape-determining protein MreB